MGSHVSVYLARSSHQGADPNNAGDDHGSMKATSSRLVAWKPWAEYTVSKHAVIGLTRSAAFMYGSHGIRVNAVAPGGVATGIPMPATRSEFGSSRLAAFLNLIPPVATAEQLAASDHVPAQ